MDDGVAIDLVDASHSAVHMLLLRAHPDVPQDRTGELGEEALNEVEPGAVLRREGELEAAIHANRRHSRALFAAPLKATPYKAACGRP